MVHAKRAMVCELRFPRPRPGLAPNVDDARGIRLDEQVAVAVATGCIGIRRARRNDGTLRRVTPSRTIAVALVTFVALYATTYVSGPVEDLLRDPGYSQELRHFAHHVVDGLLALPIAFGLYRLDSVWPATGWTERNLALARKLALGVVLGLFLAAAGGAIGFQWGEWRLEYVVAFVLHSVGEVIGFGSLVMLLVVSLVLLGIGVRGALGRSTLSG